MASQNSAAHCGTDCNINGPVFWCQHAARLWAGNTLPGLSMMHGCRARTSLI